MRGLLVFALLAVAKIAFAGPIVSPVFRASLLSQHLGDQSSFLWLGDINHDGRFDAVTASRFGDLWTLFGNSDGSFEPGPGTAGAQLDQGLHKTKQGGMYDFDGDGHLDVALLAGGFPATSIQVWKGDGAGHFAPPRTIVSGLLDDAAFGEFTGDGLLDVAATRPVQGGGDELAIYEGTAAGLFQEAQVFATGGESVYARDLDGDGRADVAWSGDNSVRVYRGQVGGGFSPPLVVSSPGVVWLVGAGDFNGDGNLDLTAQFAKNGYWIWPGNGLGGFDPVEFEPNVTERFQFRSGDVDGDGRDEILDADFRTIAEPVDGLPGPSMIALRGGAQSWEVADVDGDGSTDYVVLDALGPAISTVYGIPTGAGRTDVATGASPASVVLADLDRDGNLDAITPDFDSNQVTILWGDGTGGFPARTDLPVGNGPDALAVANLDSDSWPDVLISQQTAGSLGVLRGLGNRTFAANVSIVSGAHPHGIAAGDVTGDGLADAVVAFDLANQLKIFPGDGAGNFGAPIPIATGSAPQMPSIVDLDNDGYTDLAYALRISSNLGVRFGGADGTFAPEVNAPAAGKTTRYSVFDFDHDGLRDFASIGDFNTVVRITRNMGERVFQIYGEFVPQSVSDLASGDFDGDGVPEVAFLGGVGNGGAGAIGMNAITVPGTVPTSKYYVGAGANGSTLATGDLDHDGRPDFVVAARTNSAVSVALNRHTGPILGAEPPSSRSSRLRFASRMPARGEFLLLYDAPPAEEGRLRLLTARGSVVFQSKILPNASGPQTVRVAPTGLRGGVYWAEVRQGSFRDVVKFVFVP